MLSHLSTQLLLQFSAIAILLLIVYKVTRHLIPLSSRSVRGRSSNSVIRSIIAYIAIAGFALGFIFSFIEGERKASDIRSNLTDTARKISAGIDYRLVPYLSFSPADLENPGFLRVNQQLSYISSSLGGLPIRSFAIRSNRVVTGPSSLGQLAPVPGTACDFPHKLLRELLAGNHSIGEGPFTGEHGSYICGYAPLYNPRSSVPLLVIRVDLPVEVIRPQITRAENVPLLLLNLLLIILAGSLFLFPRDEKPLAGPISWYRSPEALFTLVVSLFLAFVLSRGAILSENRFRRAILQETTSAQAGQIVSYLRFHERRFINLANQIAGHQVITDLLFRQLTQPLVNKDFILSAGISTVDRASGGVPVVTQLVNFFPGYAPLLATGSPFPEGFNIFADSIREETASDMISFHGPFTARGIDSSMAVIKVPITSYAATGINRYLFLLINPDLILREAITLQGAERAVFEVLLSRLGIGGSLDAVAMFNVDARHELIPGYLDTGYPVLVFGEAFLMQFKPGPGFYNRYQKIAAPISIPLALFLTVILTYFVGFFSTRRNKLEAEVKKREKELDQSEHRFYRLFNSMSEAFGLYTIVRDSGGNMVNYRIVEVNMAYTQIVGLTMEEVAGRLATDVYKVARPPFIDKFNEVIITQQPLRFEGFHAPMNKHLDVSVTPWGKDGFATLFSDAGPRRQWEKALRESEEKYRLLVENQQDFIIKVDLDGRYLYASPSFLNTFDLAEQDILGKVFIPKMRVEDLSHTMAALDSLKKPPYRVRIEQRVQTVAGWRWIAWNNSAIMEAGVPVAYIGVGRDISWRKKYEQELEEHQAKLQQQNKEFALLNEEYQSLNEELVSTNEELMKAIERGKESDNLKTAFLQNISHEIRTPLNAIIGFSEMLTLPNFTGTEKDAFANLIINSSRQLLSLVNDIMTISTLETQQEKFLAGKVNINSLLEELWAIFSPRVVEKGVNLVISVPAGDKGLIIVTDEMKLTQVFNNLIGNAIKFTREGSITFGYEHAGEGIIRCFVKDSGIGIPAAFLTKIFERFRQASPEIQARYGGTGLGLAISKGHVELMGGKIWVESTPGQGSVFYFEIPVNQGQGT